MAGRQPRERRRGRISAREDLTDAYVAYSLALAGVAPGGLQWSADFPRLSLRRGGSGDDARPSTAPGPTWTPLHFAADGTFPAGRPQPGQAGRDPGRARDAPARGRYLPACSSTATATAIDIYRGDGSYLSSSFVYAAILPEIRRRFHGEGLGVFRRPQVQSRWRSSRWPGRGVTVDVIRNGHSQIKQSLIDDPDRFGGRGGIGPLLRGLQRGRAGGGSAPRTRSTSPCWSPASWHEDPGGFDGSSRSRPRPPAQREWGYKFPGDAAAGRGARRRVREHFEAQGPGVLERMKNGMDLEATLLRRGLPLRRQRAHASGRRLAPGLPAHLAERERPGPLGSRRGHARAGASGQAGNRGLRAGLRGRGRVSGVSSGPRGGSR